MDSEGKKIHCNATAAAVTAVSALNSSALAHFSSQQLAHLSQIAMSTVGDGGQGDMGSVSDGGLSSHLHTSHLIHPDIRHDHSL